MHQKILTLTGITLAAVVFLGTACSDDEGDGAKGFSCPKVGDKACASDPGATEADVQACSDCRAELSALAGCTGPATCGPDGKTKEASTAKCKAEEAKVIQCYLGGSSSGDAGAGSKDGGADGSS